ncbi:energy transducer TonB, partial [Klebsiella pneumoniae]|uniref:energy transducer TonB n=1 Tax=Klebsiella pneumoniae TaxID=573 RepID=UPI0025A2A4A8
PVGSGFDEAAIEAARQFEFSPAEINGQPSAIRIQFTYRFAFTPPAATQPSGGAAGTQPAAPREVARVVGRVRELG